MASGVLWYKNCSALSDWIGRRATGQVGEQSISGMVLWGASGRISSRDLAVACRRLSLQGSS
jgi:hypothetical protein